MKKGNIFLKIIIFIVAILIVVFVCMYVLDNKGKINQGNFRVNDVMVKSSLSVKEENTTDNTEEKTNFTSLSDIIISADQENELSFLLVSDVKPTRVYVSEIDIKSANFGNVSIYNDLDEEIFANNIMLDTSDLIATEQEGQYLVSVKINNMGIIQNRNLPEGVNEVFYDGRLIKQYGIDLNDIKFNIKFKLNIIDENGKINVCDVKLTLPNADFVTNGLSVIREDISNFIFSVK